MVREMKRPHSRELQPQSYWLRVSSQAHVNMIGGGDEESVRTNKPSNGLVGRCGILIPYHSMHRVLAVRNYLGSSRPRMRHFEEA
jgi:hypothetical protein